MEEGFAKYIIAQSVVKQMNERQAFEDAGFEIIKDGDVDRAEWARSLVMSYPQEVIAVFGSDPNDVMGLLEDEWDTGMYEDVESGLNMSWEDWADFFSGRVAHYVYGELCSLRKEYRNAVNE